MPNYSSFLFYVLSEDDISETDGELSVIGEKWSCMF